MSRHYGLAKPEPSIVAWGEQLPAGSSVLDVAAGSGRHALWFANHGHLVTAIDRDTEALRSSKAPNVRIVTADLENGDWPLPDQCFDAVVVVNYLWRRLLPVLIQAVAVHGYLLYETFAQGNERFGRPRNPDFLLQPDELLRAMPETMTVLDFWQGEVGDPASAVRQRIRVQRMR